MKSELRCIPCALTQALRSVELATEGVRDPDLRETIRDKALRSSLKELSGFSLEDSPALLSSKAIKAALRATGVGDPFEKVREEHTRLALSFYGRLRALVRSSGDPLKTSLRLAACGNAIDLGVGDSFDLEKEMERGLEFDFARDGYLAFVERLRRAMRILYIADNAGEIVFDRLVLEELPTRATVAVKSGPILNDAVMKDALSSGLSEVATLITTGTDELGLSLERCSREFKECFDSSDLIIAKGHANLETLDEEEKEIYFLLKAKCEVVARELGVEVGDSVFIRTEGGPDG